MQLDPGWTPERWAEALGPYFDEHDRIGTGATARSAELLAFTEGPDTWRVRQILDDPEGFHEWALVATVDLRASDDAGEAVVHIEAVERL